MKLQTIAADPLTLRFPGDLDLYHVESAREVLRRQFADEARVELDLGGVETCDTSGVQLLLAARRTAAASGKRLSIRSVSQAVTTCAKLLGLAPEALASDPETTP